MRKPVLILSVLLLFATTMFAQDGKKEDLQPIDPANFNKTLFSNIIQKQLKEKRYSKDKEAFVFDSTLHHTAGNQLAFCVKNHKSSNKQTGKYEKTPSRLGLYGGNPKAMASEIVFDVKWSKKGAHFTYDKVAREVTKKIKKSKYDKILLNDAFFFTGYDFALDIASGKMFVSIVVADIEALNNGIAHVEDLAVPFTPKYKYGVEKGKNFKMTWMGLFGTPDTCPNVNQALVNDLTFNAFYVDGDKVFLKKAYVAKFKSMLVKKNDAIAIDVVSKDQFPVDQYYNITDRSTFTTGYLLKPVYGKNITGIETEDILVGTLPAALTGAANFNLFVYKSKHCHDGYGEREWINNDSFAYLYKPFRPTSLALNYDTAGTKLPTFSAKENKIEFVFPFEQGKFNFNQADIQPLIDSLGEPSFLINKVKIEAYSSIEGDSIVNDKLQKRRSGSIVGVLERMNENVKIPYTVKTNTGWNKFQEQVANTDWANLGDSSMSFVNDTLYQDKALLDALEPLLAKQRYARVQLSVTYKEPDLDENEYFLFKYKKALKMGKSKDALALQNELIKNGMKEALLSIDVPTATEFASLHNNLLCIKVEQLRNDGDFNDLYASAKSMFTNYKGHALIRFNYAALTLHALNITTYTDEELTAYLEEWKTIQGEIQMTQILDADEVTRLKSKFHYYTQTQVKEFKDDKKNNKKLLETVKNLRDLEDVLAFSDLFAAKGNQTVSYEILKVNFNKFIGQLENPISDKEKKISGQYALRMIPFFNKVEEDEKYAFEANVFAIMNNASPELLRSLFEENILSFQYFDNLWIKNYFKQSTIVKEERLGL